MLGLVYKEFLLGKRSLLFATGIYLFFFVSIVLMILFVPDFTSELDGSIVSLTINWLLFTCVNMMNAEIFMKDERRIWANYAVSLPTSVKGQVKSKYYFIFIVNVLAFFISVLQEYVIAALFDCEIGLGTSIAYSLLLFFLFYSAVEIPFSTCFGRKFGNYIMSAVMLLIILVVMIYALFGDISMFLGEEEIEDAIIKLIEKIMTSDITIIIMGFSGWVTLGLYFLSYKLSCKFYLKGAETYEQ